MFIDQLARASCACLLFLVVNLCGACAQEPESELSMQEFYTLSKLRANGAIIEKTHEHWVATLSDGNELHIPQGDGTSRIVKQPKWSGTAEQIRQLADLPIHTVHIMRKSFTDEELNAVTSLKATKKLVLHLGYADISPDSLNGIGDMLDLVELFIQVPSVDHEVFGEISTLQNLKVLGFSNCDLAADDLRILHRLQSLERLNIGWTHLNEDALSELANFGKIKHIGLNNVNLLGVPAPDLRGLKSLESVSLTQVTISDDWVRALGRLRRLSSANFYGTDLTDEQFEMLVPALINNVDAADQLVTLYLDGTKISDDTVELIRSTAAMTYAKAFVVLPPTVSDRAANSLFEANPTWRIFHYRMVGDRLVGSQIK